LAINSGSPLTTPKMLSRSIAASVPARTSSSLFAAGTLPTHGGRLNVMPSNTPSRASLRGMISNGVHIGGRSAPAYPAVRA
jgi:hypothetical protein